MLDRLDLSSSSSSSSTQSSFGFNNSRSGSELDSPTDDTLPLSPSSSLSSLEIKNTSNIQEEQMPGSIDLYTQILRGMAARQRPLFEDELKGSTIASSNQGLVTPKISRLLQVCADDAGYQSDYERNENRSLLSRRKRLARRKAASKHCNDLSLSLEDERTPRCKTISDPEFTNNRHFIYYSSVQSCDTADNADAEKQHLPREIPIGLGIGLDLPLLSCATILTSEEVESNVVESAFGGTDIPIPPLQPVLHPIRLGLDSPSPIVPLPDSVDDSTFKPRLRPISAGLHSPSPILPLPSPRLTSLVESSSFLAFAFSPRAPRQLRLRSLPESSEMSPIDYLPPHTLQQTSCTTNFEGKNGPFLLFSNDHHNATGCSFQQKSQPEKQHLDKRKSYCRLGHGLPSSTSNPSLETCTLTAGSVPTMAMPLLSELRLMGLELNEDRVLAFPSSSRTTASPSEIPPHSQAKPVSHSSSAPHARRTPISLMSSQLPIRRLFTIHEVYDYNPETEVLVSPSAPHFATCSPSVSPDLFRNSASPVLKMMHQNDARANTIDVTHDGKLLF
ncbi:hypothetical protein VKT23_005195 [Stygiomarasmius scandens]|uniref:Uncharacterized protein n=1 Tax=Marasmiellus scandens TaxID=2682957 RepID=A0ABR1JUE5_9AGAR